MNVVRFLIKLFSEDKVCVVNLETIKIIHEMLTNQISKSQISIC
jgi:hypothetical protein